MAESLVVVSGPDTAKVEKTLKPLGALRGVAKYRLDDFAPLAAIGEPRRHGAAEVMRRGRPLAHEADAPAGPRHGVGDGAALSHIENSGALAGIRYGFGEQIGGLG